MDNKQVKGMGALFVITALYGLYGIYSRLIALEFGVFSQNWVRNAFVLCLAILFLILGRKKWKKIEKKDAPWIAGRVICDIVFVITLFISFNNLLIGTALFLLYSGATISAYLAGTFLLNEKLTKVKIIAITFSFAGLFFIYAGHIHSTNTFYLFLGFLTGIFSGLWNVLPKKISKEYPILQIIALDAAGVLIVNLFLAGIYHQPVPPLMLSLAWMGLLLYGITQLVGDLLLIYGFRLVEAQAGSLILPFEAVFGAIFAFFFFRETLPTAVMFGGILILIGAIVPFLPKRN